MEMRVIVSDALTPFIERVISEKPQWMGSAMKSAGYWSQKQIKAGIRSGAPGGHTYARLMPSWMRQKLEAALGNETKRTYRPLGKLGNAVGYDKRRANEGIVTVGWLSQSAVRIGSEQEAGFFTNVSERMRRAFNIAEIKLNKGLLETPARPTYQPMKPIIAAGAPKQVEIKLINYLQGVSERSTARSNRRYRVYT